MKVHQFTAGRAVLRPPSSQKARKQKKEGLDSAIQDILTNGMKAMVNNNLFQHWQRRTGGGGSGIFGGDAEAAEAGPFEEAIEEMDELAETGTVFDNPEGTLDVDVLEANSQYWRTRKRNDV